MLLISKSLKPNLYTKKSCKSWILNHNKIYILENNFLGDKMKTRAAVAVEAGKPLEIMDVDLEGPRSGEVLVEIKATGICHTDEFTLSGDDPEGLFPAILGHEGAGVVREVGMV